MIVVHKDTDITEYVSSMSWGGSRSEVARKLELHIVNAPLDKNITPLTINLADPVYLFEDDGKTELFRGFVVEREGLQILSLESVAVISLSSLLRIWVSG